MDLRHPYLTGQLIAYIGNKRALLPFLHGVFSRLADGSPRVSFLDPFAGSGSVSRLARLMGFAVGANDWEPYSWVINSCHLLVGETELGSLFRSRGGIDAVLGELNLLSAPPEEERYIARHFAPRRTETADWRTERLFYTTENALFIDAVRERIEEMYPGIPAGETAFKEKMALLAPLVYAAATRTNTSGVFKAFHRGFGGHGGDALKRITGPIRMERPLLADSPSPAAVSRENAADFLRARSADICYLDPPYSVHQYGSNYFMLNTIALWDRPPVSGERGPDGRLLRKAGIREDWTRTRSAFCYAGTALPALREVVSSADCRWLAVSYSNEGLVGLEELCDMLAETGDLTVHSTGYAKYPGGKQSLARRTRNVELLLVVDRRTAPSAGARQMTARRLLDLRIARLMGSSFDPARIRETFRTDGEGRLAGLPAGADLGLPMPWFHRFAPGTNPPRLADPEDAKCFLALLSSCEIADAREEIRVLREMLRGENDPRERRRIFREILRFLNRLAHAKYRGIFLEELEALRILAAADPRGERFRAGLEKVAERASRRMHRG